MEVIIISAAGIHKGAIQVREYPVKLGFPSALKLFCENFPQATQISITEGEEYDQEESSQEKENE